MGSLMRSAGQSILVSQLQYLRIIAAFYNIGETEVSVVAPGQRQISYSRVH
jgi:hypothetical protein